MAFLLLLLLLSSVTATCTQFSTGTVCRKLVLASGKKCLRRYSIGEIEYALGDCNNSLVSSSLGNFTMNYYKNGTVKFYDYIGSKKLLFVARGADFMTAIPESSLSSLGHEPVVTSFKINLAKIQSTGSTVSFNGKYLAPKTLHNIVGVVPCTVNCTTWKLISNK